MSLIDDMQELQLEEIDAVELLGFTGVPSSLGNPQIDTLVLKERNLFFLSDQRGNVPQSPTSHLGLFSEDTRFLSQWEAVVLGQEPSVLSSQANRVFCNQIDLTTSSGEVGKDIYEHSYMHIRRRQALSDKFLERIRVSNYLNIPLRLKLLLRFASDFADMFEVRGLARVSRGTYYRPIIRQNVVMLLYRGLDGMLRVTQIVFDSLPTHFDYKSAEFDMVIEPGGTFLLEAHVIPSVEHLPTPEKRESYATIFKYISDDYSKWRSHCTVIRSDDEFLASSLDQSVTDLRALLINYDNLPIISAGIPWYSTPFGRDSLITSLQTLMVNPDIARDTLVFLAKYQGARVDDFTNEEPGKILHEIRRGEMARCGEIPHVPYYGTVDATPLFLVVLYQYWLWTGDEELVRTLLPNVERALHWIDTYGDVDGDGFVEYWRYTERGCLHQGWKDSVDGVTFPDGTQPQLPIALVEVQGYVYEGKLGMSRIYRALGMQEKAKVLRAQAEQMKERIDEFFWLKEQKFYALALDGRNRRVPAITSNPAHLLFSRAVGQGNAGRVERRLMSDDMFSGWGIRTLSSSHAAYNPLSYHNGSVWPHDNAIALVGLCNYNFKKSAERVFNSLYEASLHFQYYRLPELFCGMHRQPNDSPVHYPVACTPQAWAAASFFMMIQGLLGIRPEASKRSLHIDNPRLPHNLGDMTIRNLRIGKARVTLRVTRQNERTFVNVVEQTGESVRVTIEWN